MAHWRKQINEYMEYIYMNWFNISLGAEIMIQDNIQLNEKNIQMNQVVKNIEQEVCYWQQHSCYQ